VRESAATKKAIKPFLAIGMLLQSVWCGVGT
jgi:hypothetical protein